MIAQALIEKSLLDGLSFTLSNAFYAAGDLIHRQPWIVVALVAVALLLLRVRR